jgi:septal ring factor EnvC (AmiA/AmiB activator)
MLKANIALTHGTDFAQSETKEKVVLEKIKILTDLSAKVEADIIHLNLKLCELQKQLHSQMKLLEKINQQKMEATVNNFIENDFDSTRSGSPNNQPKQEQSVMLNHTAPPTTSQKKTPPAKTSFASFVLLL